MNTRVSVVIPVRNGGSNFRRCLEAIHDSGPPPYEVLVVDDGSTDESARMACESGATLLMTPQPGGGPAVARNVGAIQAGGDVILFVDSDVALHPDAIGRVRRNFSADPDLVACFGSYDDRPAAPNFVSQYKNLFHHYVHQSARDEASTFWAGCGAIRRDAFLAAGGFDSRYSRPAIEDVELGCRLKSSGGKLRLDKRLQATHLKRWTLRSLLRSDIFDRGVPWTRLILQRRGLIDDLNLRMRSRVSVVAVYAVLTSCVAGCVWPAALAAAGASAIGLLAINSPLYRFLAARRGWLFALRAIPMHWLYYWYNGLAFAMGLVSEIVE